jgi:hypothetical protein
MFDGEYGFPGSTLLLRDACHNISPGVSRTLLNSRVLVEVLAFVLAPVSFQHSPGGLIHSQWSIENCRAAFRATAASQPRAWRS